MNFREYLKNAMYNVTATRNGKNVVMNKNPMTKEEAEAFADDLKKAKIPSVDAKSISVDRI